MKSLQPGLIRRDAHTVSKEPIQGPSVKRQTRTDEASQEELQAARYLTSEFMRRMEQTKDVGTLRDLYVDDFVVRYLAREWPDLGSSLSYSRVLLTPERREDWERYYAAQVNLRYFMVLHIASTFTPAGIRAMERGESPAAILFPSEAWEVLKGSPFLLWDYSADNPSAKREGTTSEELRGLIATLEQANSIMRKRFLTDPPEQSELYKQNTGAPTPSSKQRESPPYLEIAHEERLGFPAGTHFFHVLTTPELFELTLVKTEKGMKVAWARVYPFN